MQRRVLNWLVVILPASWLIALGGSYYLAKHEVDELFDTQQFRLAEQALANAINLSDANQAPQELQPAHSLREANPTEDFFGVSDACAARLDNEPISHDNYFNTVLVLLPVTIALTRFSR